MGNKIASSRHRNLVLLFSFFLSGRWQLIVRIFPVYWKLINLSCQLWSDSVNHATSTGHPRSLVLSEKNSIPSQNSMADTHDKSRGYCMPRGKSTIQTTRLYFSKKKDLCYHCVHIIVRTPNVLEKIKVSFGGIFGPNYGSGRRIWSNYGSDILEHDNTEIFYSLPSAGCINFPRGVIPTIDQVAPI